MKSFMSFSGTFASAQKSVDKAGNLLATLISLIPDSFRNLWRKNVTKTGA